MAELQLFNLPGLVASAGEVNANRQENRLLQLMEPYKLREAERKEQEAVLDRDAAAARMSLVALGDNFMDLPVEQRQERFSTVRNLMGSLGVDVSRVPEQYSDDLYRGLEALANVAGGSASTTVQSTYINGRGERVAIMRDGSQQVLGEAENRQQLTPEGLAFDPRSGVVAAPAGADLIAQRREEEAQRQVITAGGKRAAELGVEVSMAPQIAGARGVVAGAEETAKGQAGGAQRSIDQAIELANAAAPGIAPIARAIDLMDSVQTGGLTQQALLQLRQATGSESADAGELSGLLGRSVLSQLRLTFGAAFTEKEGARLQSIEAGFGKSQGTNRRLLQNAFEISHDAVERGIRAAERRGDDFTADELRRRLDFRLGQKDQNPQGGQSPAGIDQETEQILKGLGI